MILNDDRTEYIRSLFPENENDPNIRAELYRDYSDALILAVLHSKQLRAKSEYWQPIRMELDNSCHNYVGQSGSEPYPGMYAVTALSIYRIYEYCPDSEHSCMYAMSQQLGGYYVQRVGPSGLITDIRATV